MGEYRHNYIGNVFASLFDGFRVKGIEFDNQEFLFEITGQMKVLYMIEQDSGYFGRAIIESKREKDVYRNGRRVVQEVSLE